MPTATLSDDTDLMSSDVLGDPEHEVDGISVDSPADAERLFRAIKGLEGEILKLEKEQQSIIEQTQAFYDRKIESRQDRIDFLKAKIDAFVRATGESIDTPSGRAYEQSRTKWDYADDDQIVAWAEEHAPHLVQTEKKVSKTDLKNHIKEHGGGDEVADTRQVESVVSFAKSDQ